MSGANALINNHRLKLSREYLSYFAHQGHSQIAIESNSQIAKRMRSSVLNVE
jgi:hypothetical protein